MSIDLSFRMPPPQEAPPLPVRAAGPARSTGAPPPSMSVEAGPPNPRLRMDSSLGMVVIEFRDAAGKVSTSLPTERELQAYRAAVNYRAELPANLRPLRRVGLTSMPTEENEPRMEPSARSGTQSLDAANFVQRSA